MTGLLETLITSITYRHSRMASGEQCTRSKKRKRAKVRENEEDVLTAAEGLLNMSAKASSCEDALRDASTQTDHAFPMLDPNYLVLPNQELSVDVAALQELALETFTAKISTSANGKQQPQRLNSMRGYLHMKFSLLCFTTWSPGH